MKTTAHSELELFLGHQVWVVQIGVVLSWWWQSVSLRTIDLGEERVLGERIVKIYLSTTSKCLFTYNWNGINHNST